MKISNKNQINIGCACNDAYAQHLGIMIYSLLKNCANPEKIRIFFMDGGITNENKRKISSVVNHYSAKIVYINPNNESIAGLKECRHISRDAYYRFFIIENQKLDKLLYLDADIIINADIKELWDTNFDGNIIFAVKDPGGSEQKKKSLGINPKSYYFNSGVMLVDCKKWRKEKITKKAIDFMKNNPEKIEYADQDGLNAVLVGKWKTLNPKWNLITRLVYYNFLPFLKIPNYDQENVSEIIKNPKIIHYASFIKPWYYLDPSPYKKEYLKYLAKTPWKDYRQPDKTFTGVIKRINYYLKIIKQKF